MSHFAESFIVGLEKAEADLKAVAHRLEEGFEQQYGRHQVRASLYSVACAQRYSRGLDAIRSILSTFSNASGGLKGDRSSCFLHVKLAKAACSYVFLLDMQTVARRAERMSHCAHYQAGMVLLN